MELSKTIKRLRTEKGWSQETLAEKSYVSRQTISNWENEKNYPDVHSLLILSDLFGVSLDELIKGDVETMKNTIHNKDAYALKRAQWCGVIGLILLMAVVTPIYEHFGTVGMVIGSLLAGALAVFTFMSFHKMEAIKSEHDIQTQREILAFMNGETLDDIEKAKEQEIRKSNRRGMIVALVICGISIIVTAVHLIKMAL
ncbi:helix-turn-helix domain-containing protein [Ruminococcus albus]|uniref:Helix-turn-helix domain protein n=1 Tax=Ruminococcus albus (strain ATCC 27210 / DSM 20455 / JCM 14654 / NCDO 2250 / 7) TaxID=697329 RepID=E6UB56_RUMA7|nr:helix-turn-helix transcriptional regulator [Ruminococcus albus]ADU20597.1 helix-turn-helix domain protein [Ruminococcus albus 7 = DSM 20455]